MGLKSILVAGDTFRAAAVEQLQIWGERTGAPVVSGAANTDAAGLAFNALARAQPKPPTSSSSTPPAACTTNPR